MLRTYGPGDLELQLRLLGDPDTMAHLGGPETPLQIERRHERYLAMTDPAEGEMLVVEQPEGVAAGCIGYWPRGWQGEPVWETGWFVLPEQRGRGIATTALHELLARIAPGERRAVHAFPSVDNAPSNAICRKAGFTLAGAVDFEYPPGNRMRCNDWRIALDV